MPASTPSRWLALLLLVCSSFGCTGCSLIGLGIGSAIPKWEDDVAPKSLEWNGKGEKPVVEVRADDEGREGPPGLVVTTAGGERRIPLPDVQRVDVHTGSYWAEGLGVGAAIDLTVAILLGVVGASMLNHPFGGFNGTYL